VDLPAGGIEIKHRVDDRSLPANWIGNEIGEAVGALVEKRRDLRPFSDVGAPHNRRMTRSAGVGKLCSPGPLIT
jgi:hypothetical protein